jgi:pimeloyl-ACP methyl ester carboxylesterase
MALMQRRLRVQDYAVSTYSYPTVRVNLAENAERLARYCNALDCDKVHLVAHSMGGLVALKAAGLIAPARLGRIVLIGTPFVDCYSGRQFEHLPGGRWLLGKCMAQWLREPRPQLFDRFDIGVIAGDGGFGLGPLRPIAAAHGVD